MKNWSFSLVPLTISQAASQFPNLIACVKRFEDLADLRFGKACIDQSGGQTKLACVEGAIDVTSLSERMKKSSWPLALVRHSTLPQGQFWSVSRSGTEERSLCEDDLVGLGEAAGCAAIPKGNLRLTWSIRRYADKDEHLGSHAWLVGVIKAQQVATSFFSQLLRALFTLFQRAETVGTRLYVEQISAVLAKDPEAPNPCLTPRVHSDEYYGPGQSGIVSLLEPGWSLDGGTWFLPTLNSQQLPPGNRIDAPRFQHHFPNTPIVAAGSGDLCIYDGMRNEAGELCGERGLPHVSGDQPGRSARLVVLLSCEHREGAVLARVLGSKQ